MRKNLFIALCCMTLIACSGNQQESKVVEDTVFQTVKDTVVAECTDTQQIIEADTPATIKNDFVITKPTEKKVIKHVETSSICTLYYDEYLEIDKDFDVYEKVDEMPIYKGFECNDISAINSLRRDILENFDCEIDSSVSGLMVFRFIISPKGKAVKPIILKGFGNSLYESCVLNAVLKLDTFEPGECAGQKVYVWGPSIPIIFKDGLPL